MSFKMNKWDKERNVLDPLNIKVIQIQDVPKGFSQRSFQKCIHASF